MTCEEDAVLRVIGGIGRWQVYQSVLLSLVGVVCGWQVLGITFLAPPTEHWCAPPPPPPPSSGQQDDGDWRQVGIHDGSLDEVSQCTSSPPANNTSPVPIADHNITIPCHSWVYNTSEYSSNIIIEWDLVCDRQWLQTFSQAVYMIGVMFGVLFWGVIADRYGRRPTLLLCVTLAFLAGTACAAASSVLLFVAFRFMIAFCGIGAYCACFVTCMEMLGDWWRVVIGIAFCIPMSVGYMTLAVIAYFVRDWRMLQLAISLPGALYLGYYWTVPESPRWLLSRRRPAEATAIMQRIRQYNKMDALDSFTESQDPSETGSVPSESCLDLITNWRMLAILVCLFCCWFVNSMVFYGILLNTGDFGENIYLNAFLGGVVEVPAYVTCIYAILKLGRRRPICLAMQAAGICCLLTLALNKDQYHHGWPVVCLAMLSRFGITASFGSIYIYSAELFPTSVRNTGLATCSVGSRFGGILAPLLLLLRSSVHPSLPVAVYGLSAIVSGLSVLLLPETASRPLPEKISDVVGTQTRSRPSGRAEDQQQLNLGDGVS